ncbi:MAG TPA: glycosyltransferase family 2 protein [Candidatus Limnocylindrales bacterium]|jgi:dolichol-phosphate mannosyltransferase|nr:glycosyltransferase family 2 protein [Candidatus Limnocylindrales bacterium]
MAHHAEVNREPHTANAASLATSEKSSGESVSNSNESASGPAARTALRAPGSTAGSVPEISVVVPFWNEELNVVRLADEVFKAFQNESRTLELVLVDDASSDGTWQQMLQAQQSDTRVRPLRLVCHSGQSAALWAGFTASRGSIIATLDGDLQNDPADLPRMLKELTTYDLVCGLRIKRMDNRVRRISTAVARWARKTALGVDFRDSGCNLRVFKRTVLEKLFPFDGLHRFMPIIAHYAGAQVIETPVQHHARTAGKSKYGVWNRVGRGIWDLIGVAWYRKRQLKNLAAIEAPAPKPAASENRP